MTTAVITSQKMFPWQQLSSNVHSMRCSHNGSSITAQAIFTQQQLPSQHRCPHNNSCHHSRDIHMTTAAITTQMFTQKQLPSQHKRCSHNNSCYHSKTYFILHKMDLVTVYSDLKEIYYFTPFMCT